MGFGVMVREGNVRVLEAEPVGRQGKGGKGEVDLGDEEGQGGEDVSVA